jgi:hypothetical protein
MPGGAVPDGNALPVAENDGNLSDIARPPLQNCPVELGSATSCRADARSDETLLLPLFPPNDEGGRLLFH